MPPPSSPLVAGARTAAPQAFLQFCERTPAECASDGESTAQVSAKVARLQIDRPLGVSDIAPAATSRADAGPDWEWAFRAVKEQAAPRPARPREAQADLALTPGLWRTLNKVNRRVNGALAQSSDLSLYGVDDYWALPMEDGVGRGDCEDFALEKRRALITAGVPADNLSIAIVTTPAGQAHAVLVIATDRGDYVLDSLSAWITPWTETSYTWRKRQTPGRPFDWATLEVSAVLFARASTPAK